MDIKKKIIITGQKVHEIGYRPFLLGMAESLEIGRFFADNTFINKKQAVYALVESSEEKVEAFVEMASSKYPDKSDVERVDVEDYSGNVMRIESYYRYLTAMQLSKIAAYGGKMLEKQDKTLEKQDRSIELLETIKEDTSDMKSTLSRMKEKQDKMLEKQDSLLEVTEKGFGDMRTGFVEVKEEIHMLRDDFRELFMREVNELRGEIAEIKAALARMQAG